MTTIIQDDRTPEQKETHVYAVVGTDLLSDISNFSLWYDINADQLKHFHIYVVRNPGEPLRI